MRKMLLPAVTAAAVLALATPADAMTTNRAIHWRGDVHPVTAACFDLRFAHGNPLRTGDGVNIALLSVTPWGWGFGFTNIGPDPQYERTVCVTRRYQPDQVAAMADGDEWIGLSTQGSVKIASLRIRAR